MPIIPDLRFALIATEGFVARRYTEIALQRMERLEAEISLLIHSELERAGGIADEDERNIASAEMAFLEEELPRLECYGVVVVLFAIIESTIKRLASMTIQPRGAKIENKPGNSFLARANRHFIDHLGVPLFDDPKHAELIQVLADVRHCVAHASGNISMLKPANNVRLTAAVKRFNGLTISRGYLTISPSFLRELAGSVECVLRSLIARAKANSASLPLAEE